jgi:hypothetical protein
MNKDWIGILPLAANSKQFYILPMNWFSLLEKYRHQIEDSLCPQCSHSGGGVVKALFVCRQDVPMNT